MIVSRLKEELIKIAGANVLADNDLEKAKMAKAINYFAVQMQMAISDIEHEDSCDQMKTSMSNICDWTAEILAK
jgi:hypothetical protein